MTRTERKLAHLDSKMEVLWRQYKDLSEHRKVLVSSVNRELIRKQLKREFKQIRRLKDESGITENTKLSDIPFSVRSMNILDGQMFLCTIGELLRRSPAEVFKKRNCGIKTLVEIDSILRECGFEWMPVHPEAIRN